MIVQIVVTRKTAMHQIWYGKQFKVLNLLDRNLYCRSLLTVSQQCAEEAQPFIPTWVHMGANHQTD